MIICFIGTVGAGKTLSMVYEAYKYYRQGFTVYSNFGLSFPHTKLTKRVFDGMIKDKTQLQNAVLLLDEVHIWLDSRSSMKKKNKAISYFILQTRKRNVRLLCTTQHLHQVDKRLRDTIDILVFCRNMSNASSTVKNVNTKQYIGQEYIFQWKRGAKPKNKVILANPVYGLYDTSEMIDMDEDEEEEK